MDADIWDSTAKPTRLLAALSPFLDQRKARLLIVACADSIWDQFEPGTQSAIRAGELLADARLKKKSLATARAAARAVGESHRRAIRNHDSESQRLYNQRQAKGHTVSQNEYLVRGAARQRLSEQMTVAGIGLCSLADRCGVDDVFLAVTHVDPGAAVALIRDIYLNPFRPVAFAAGWRSEAAVSLASTMYESRDFSPMPVLADALEDAGCDAPDVLGHCRGPGPHVRGCWAVDLVLGRA